MGTIPTTYQEVLYWYPDVIRQLEKAQSKSRSPHKDTPLEEWRFAYHWGEWIEMESWADLQALLQKKLEIQSGLRLPDQEPSLLECIEKRLNSIMVSVEAKPPDKKSRACISAGRSAWKSTDLDRRPTNVIPWDLPSPVISCVVNEEIEKASEEEIDKYFEYKTAELSEGEKPVVIVPREDRGRLEQQLELYPEEDVDERLANHFAREFGVWFNNFKIPSGLLVKRPGLAAYLALLYDRLYHCMWNYTQPQNILHAFKQREELRDQDKDYDSYKIFPCVRATNFIIKRWLELLPIGGAERELMESYFRYYDGCESSQYLCHVLLYPEIEAALEKKVRP